MFERVTRRGESLKTGFPALDRMMDIDSGIITVRSRNIQWLSTLSSNVLVRNHSKGRKTLYLHWMDYHRRAWTIDFDRISRLCKMLGEDMESLSDDTYFVRAFSRDNAETEENWERIFSFGKGIRFAVLDSVSELFEEGRGKAPVQKSMTYAIGMFSRLCHMNSCVGLVLDHSRRGVHEYLGEVSSIVAEFDVGERIGIRLVKHPRIRSGRMSIGYPRQNSLRWWLS